MSFRNLSLQRRYSGQAGHLVNDFYVPILGQATRYDRQSAYFDSASLAQVAAGLATFIQRYATLPLPVGRAPMRLITGADWSPEDVLAYRRGLDALHESLGQSLLRHLEPDDEECLRLGLPPGWQPKADQIAAHRFGALAWMVAHHLLEVKVALPLDSDGRPYSPGRGGALFHPKAGILYNDNEDVISFQGSINETSAAWTRNREKFEVKRSWYSEQDLEDIRAEQEEFETIWEGRDPGLLVIPLPEAIQQRFREYLPAVPPSHDIMEVGEPYGVARPRDRLIAQFFLEAPRMTRGENLVLDPLTLNPFPHQSKIADRATRQFPRRFLFCDEVGLGKTIEAGLSLRTLVLKGQAPRVLLITPKSLVRQWQEELREKFALTAWYFDGRSLTDVGGRVRYVENPWEESGIIIVSRQFVARRSRLEEVWAVTKQWNLVIVDEAHAARRQRLDDNSPNRLLDLLQGMNARQQMDSLWLLTATPMQLNPVEVHDLLLLCGLDNPSWGNWQDPDHFVNYYDRLREFPNDLVARSEVLKMAEVAVRQGATPLSADNVPPGWSEFAWRNIVEKINTNRPGLELALRGVTPERAEDMLPFLARQTPLAVHMFRYTRTTLRAYQEHGLLPGSVPIRAPSDIAVSFETAQERELYNRIDILCSRFYRLAEYPPGERQGVGFLAAVFRKRLASSFFAFQKSLERRRNLIESAQHAELESHLRDELESQVEEEVDEDFDSAEGLIDAEYSRLRQLPRNRRQAELYYLNDYIRDLSALPFDSKYKAFRSKLEQLLHDEHRVLVFTQYLDTLDFIRNQLVSEFGDRLICYSGRGGEIWDADQNRWRLVEKAEIKARARYDHPHSARILLATDAASEGLNLQEFSAVVNYDLPWNPMRVEQRIGRIDRIGQPRPVVAVVNLYQEGTIEQDAYLILKERIHFFEEVVGPLQPILAEMPRLLRRVALGEMERAEAIEEMNRIACDQRREPLQALERFTGHDEPPPPYQPTHPGSGPGPRSPATQEQLANWCVSHPAMGMILTPTFEPGINSGPKKCYKLTWAESPPNLGIAPTDELLITFDAAIADRHPPTAPLQDDFGLLQPGKEGVRLLTWGEPLLEAWLTSVRGEEIPTVELARMGIDKISNDYRWRETGRPVYLSDLLQ